MVDEIISSVMFVVQTEKELVNVYMCTPKVPFDIT